MRDSLTLSGEPYQILEAEKGRVALDLIAAERPDVVLLDITMPDVSGVPIFAEIKHNPSTVGISVIVVSSTTSSEFIAETLRAGASDYITKPFQPTDLARRVHKVLSDRVAA